MIDRNKAFEIGNNGLLLENGGHFSSGVGAPTHTGLRGDLYLNTINFSLYRLAVDGSVWGLISGKEIFFDNTSSAFVSENVEDAIKELSDILASGIQNYSVTSTTPFTTTSTTFVLITGFTVTPEAGTYAVFYNASVLYTTTPRFHRWSIFRDGVELADSRRDQLTSRSNQVMVDSTIAVATFNGSQTCDVRVHRDPSAAGSLTVNARTLLLIRLGP